jgi:uncharacterized membrane protein
MVALAACAVMLIAGFLLKSQCLDPPGFDGRQYSRLCYNDIQPLYSFRAVETDTFPYVNGSYTADGNLIDGANEYPVLTGLFFWFVGLFVNSSNGFLQVTALLMAPFALLTAYLLARMTGWRALMWAAAPALVYYAFHNWDLLAVAAVVAGAWFWHRGKNVAAAVAFGVGAALKLYPIMFVVPLVVERWVAGRRSEAGRGEAGRVLAAGAGTALAINLPFMLINFQGWWGTYKFHQLRGPNFDSIWGLLQTRYTWSLIQMPTLNTTVAVLTILTFITVLLAGAYRTWKGGAFPGIQVAGALLVTFMLWNKVHSPQYTLWLLPFFALLRVNLGWWIAYTIVDTVAYVGIFRWFYDYSYLGTGLASTTAKEAMVVAVWTRAALLVALLVVFLRARTAAAPESGFSSHPPSSLDAVGDPAVA